MNLEWYVFYHSINKNEIAIFNIFRHGGFNEDVQKSLKKFKDKNEFGERLRSLLSYYFRCKSEYEIIISPWCGGIDTKDVKVDIYTQVTSNWDIFLDYVWNSKQHRTTKNAGRGYVKATGKCPMCEDCPDNCPLEKGKNI